jgi:type II secretory pathway component PulF
MTDEIRSNGAQVRLTADEAAQLSHQIAGLTSSGLPLAQGLLALGEELPQGRLRHSVTELARTLEGGVPLEQAVQQHADRIAPHLRGLVIAGVRSGRLGDLLNRFAAYTAIGTELNRRLWLGLIYPVVTGGTAVVIFILVCGLLIGQFEAIFADFNLPLPALTRVLFRFAGLVNSAIGPILFGGAVLAAGWLAARVLLKRSIRRSLAGRLPLVGTVWRSTSLAEFCHLLALLLESDLPLPEALQLTGQGVQDADIDSACRRMTREVEAGRSLSQAMAGRWYFPLGLARLLSWAEGQKSLAEVLHIAGSMFEARARSYSSFVGALLSVLCVLPVLAVIMIVPALFVPLIVLINSLSG